MASVEDLYQEELHRLFNDRTLSKQEVQERIELMQMIRDAVSR